MENPRDHTNERASFSRSGYIVPGYTLYIPIVSGFILSFLAIPYRFWLYPTYTRLLGRLRESAGTFPFPLYIYIYIYMYMYM